MERLDRTRMLFENIDLTTVLWRTNTGTDDALAAGLKTTLSRKEAGMVICDLAGGGLDAGCDPRATCKSEAKGGVLCSCTQPLAPKNGSFPDGSQCEMSKPELDISQSTKNIAVTARSGSPILCKREVREADRCHHLTQLCCSANSHSASHGLHKQ